MTFFDRAYDGVPDWDIGRPQKEIKKLAQEEVFGGTILDVGCGTGENALYLAGLGYDVTGIDVVARAIATAKGKAADRVVTVDFRVHDAMDLGLLKQEFDTIIDCGLFHAFSDEDRPIFVKSLADALKPGGFYVMMCFSDREPRGWGPRRISQRRIRLTFGKGWKINFIRAAEFETNRKEGSARAWVASITKTG